MAKQYRLQRVLGRIISMTASNTINKKFHKEEYIRSINRVIDHIEKNLHKDLLLDDLARVANFSKFHFHRIFKAITGEALNKYIQRLRMEKAASQLLRHPQKPIINIAYECGFESFSSFDRIFKEYFSMSPGEWRNSPKVKKSKNGIIKSKNRKDQANLISYVKGRFLNFIKRIALSHKELKTKKLKIEIKEMPEINVAYLRYQGPFIYNDNPVYELGYKLVKWAVARGLVKFPEVKVILVYHDRAGITDDGKLRISICLEIPADVKVDGDIGNMKISGGKYAVGYFEKVPINEALDVWRIMYNEWLPSSGYMADSRLPFEIYSEDRRRTPDHTATVDIYVPVKPL